MGQKTLSEIALFTDKVNEMSQFYQRLIGSKPVAESPDMAIFMVGMAKIFIHKSYSPKPGELPSESHMALSVPDVDAACRELEKQGLQVEFPPKDYYWGRSTYLHDPDGHFIEITETKS